MEILSNVNNNSSSRPEYKVKPKKDNKTSNYNTYKYSTYNKHGKQKEIPLFLPRRRCLDIWEIPVKKLGFFTTLPKKEAISKKLADSPLADLDDDVFFIRMKHYQKDKLWAKGIKELTYKTADMINLGYSFDTICEFIKENLRRINKNNNYCQEKNYYSLFPIRTAGRGCEYFETYKKVCLDYQKEAGNDSNEVYIQYNPKGLSEKVNVCTLSYQEKTSRDTEEVKIIYGSNYNTFNKKNLDFVKEIFDDFRRIKNPTKKQLNKTIATIHWLIAQETPFSRGSDSFANVLTKAIYISKGYNLSPIKQGKSFDFEAFYRDLDDYIRIYPKLFEIEPYKQR